MRVVKLKTKVVATEKKYHKVPMGPDAQENAGDRVAIGFHSLSDWLARVLETNRY